MKKGFSLIELMIALIVFITLAVLTFKLLNSTQKASTLSQFYINTQSDSRKAYLEIINKIQNASAFVPTDAFMPSPIIFPGYTSSGSEEDISTNRPNGDTAYLSKLTDISGLNIVYTGDNTNNGEVLALIDRKILSANQNDSTYFNLENYNLFEYKITQDPTNSNKTALQYISYNLENSTGYPPIQANIENIKINSKNIFKYYTNYPYVIITRDFTIPLTNSTNNNFKVMLSLPSNGPGPYNVITFTIIRQPLLKQNFQLTGAISGANRSCSAYRLVLDVNAYLNSHTTRHKNFRYDSVVNILSTSSIPTY